MKKLVMFLLMLITITFISGCDVGDFEIDGDYVYQWVKGEYALQKLSEEGTEKEILVLPTFYKGNTFRLGALTGYFSTYGLTSAKSKKTFVPSSFTNLSYPFFEGLKGKIFIISAIDNSILSFCDKYIPYLRYQEVKSSSPANIGYDYNYEGSPNRGYYWIDDYSYGEKITFIPENPTREGYIFGGWYKETECMNRWEYERDTLPEEVLNNEEKTIFQETKLYAKWIKRQY